MKTLILGVFLALAAVSVPAVAQGDPVVSAVDDRGDVRFTQNEGLTASQRRTVDLRRLTVTPTENGPRFQLRLRRIVTSGSFDQYFYVYLVADSGLPLAYFKIFASTLRGVGGIEGSDTPPGYASCRVRGFVSKRHHQLTVRLPSRCVPNEPVNVSVFAYTTPLGKAGGSRLFSKDRLRNPGLVDVRG